MKEERAKKVEEENKRLREEQADLYKFLSIHEARIEAALTIIKNYLSTPGCPDMLAKLAMRLRSALTGEGE